MGKIANYLYIYEIFGFFSRKKRYCFGAEVKRKETENGFGNALNRGT